MRRVDGETICATIYEDSFSMPADSKLMPFRPRYRNNAAISIPPCQRLIPRDATDGMRKTWRDACLSRIIGIATAMPICQTDEPRRPSSISMDSAPRAEIRGHGVSAPADDKEPHLRSSNLNVFSPTIGCGSNNSRNRMRFHFREREHFPAYFLIYKEGSCRERPRP